MESVKGKRTKVVAILEDALAEALDYILDTKGYSSTAEFIRDKVRREAEELGFFRYRGREEKSILIDTDGDCEVIQEG